MKKLITVFIGFLIIHTSYSQSASIKGTIRDTVENKNLPNTVVALLRTKDSVLAKFTRVDKEGNFAITGLQDGKYILMITHPYVGDYFDNLELQNSVLDLGNVYLTPKSKLLAEVIIKSGSPIRIKGDTTVYTADSFKVRPGANVEELLRRLPGIQVDKNGEITAMGERVKKVLVDGEEFFGSDPGIATKNLRADAVKEVEVFDKKSDQAEFTGIDDGVKDKTINLKMKEQKGYFGKLEAGGGLKDKYNLAGMLNAFKAKRKIAAYGLMSNTGKTNLDWKDAQNYGGEIDGMKSGISDDGGMFISFSGGDENYWGGRNGIPKNWSGGLHFSDKFNKDKLSFNSGYKFSKVNSPGVTSTFSNTFLPDTSWLTNTRNENFPSNIKHAFNLTFETNIDSNNSIKWSSKVNNNSTRATSNYYSETLNEAGQFINNSTRNSDNNTEKNSVTSSILWRHKFKKLYRTLSVNTDILWNESRNKGFLYSLNNYYAGGILNERDTTDQQNIQNSEGKGISTRLAYTEPLMKDTYLEFSYSLAYNNNINERITNIKNINGKYETPIDTLSNSFEFNRIVHTPGLNFRVNKKKYNFSFGSSVGFSHFIQNNITEDRRDTYDYINYYPRASYTYKIKPNESVRFNYNGSSTAPTLEQLQPTRINTDPLNIYIGNPNLNQSFRHSFNTGYNSFNVLKERNFFSNLSFSTTKNAFVQSSIIDSVGRRTYQTVNTDGVYNLNLYSDYGIKITKLKLRFGVGPTANFSRNVDFVNGVKNMVDNRNYGMSINISKHVENKYNFYLGTNFNRNHSKASVNTAANAKYWQMDGWANGNFTLPHKFEIATDMNFQLKQKDPRFTQNTNYATWNATVIKRLMKENALELKFTVYDILDQNRGYQRSFNSYSFTESYYTTLRRFWLVSLVWNITKNGKPATTF